MTAVAHDDHAHDDHKPPFFTRWFMSTNHKDIGTLYIIFSIFTGLIGGLFSVLMRAELQRIVDTPGLSRDVFEIASKSLA